jgi:hypothetical protein
MLQNSFLSPIVRQNELQHLDFILVSLTFARKDCLSGAPYGGLLASLANIGVACKNLPVTNTLAYFVPLSVSEKK